LPDLPWKAALTFFIVLDSEQHYLLSVSLLETYCELGIIFKLLKRLLSACTMLAILTEQEEQHGAGQLVF
jgi:hypothetical protein